jgi:hypothetical protein
MFGLTSLFDVVLRIVRAWKPKGRYGSEDGYRNDLKDFLRAELNRPSALTIGPQRRIKVTSESGRHLCDIAVDEKIGIELKKDFRTIAEVDRLIGQLHRFNPQYPNGLIVVLVGNTGEDAREELMSRVNRVRVKVVDKGFAELEKERPRTLFALW